jgi:alpha-beta hydrolase superfamily lysophospholipase
MAFSATALTHVCTRRRLGEHVNRYNHVFGVFAAAGIAVSGYDQRGCGRSDGLRGDGGFYTTTMEDLAAVWDRVYDAQVPNFLVGHSLGGLHVLSFAAKYAGDRKIAGVVASAPALQPAFQPPWVVVSVGRLLRNIPGVNMIRVANELSTPRPWRRTPCPTHTHTHTLTLARRTPMQMWPTYRATRRWRQRTRPIRTTAATCRCARERAIWRRATS